MKSPRFLHFKDFENGYPLNCYGDLLFLEDCVVFIAFSRSKFTSVYWVIFLGVLGFIFRSSAMDKWRDEWKNRDPRDIISEYPKSWKLEKEEIHSMKHRFIKLNISTDRDKEPYRFTIGIPQWKQIQNFIATYEWNVQC